MIVVLLCWLCFKQVMIMKQLDHPNIVKLIEVIDDPESDNYYMGNALSNCVVSLYWKHALHYSSGSVCIISEE